MSMKTRYIILSFLLYACSAKEAKEQISKESFINDIFLSVLDTTAYGFRSLLPPSSDSLIPYSMNDTFRVAFAPNLFALSEWVKSIDITLKEPEIRRTVDTAYQGLITKVTGHQASLSSVITVKDIQNTGRYRLTSTYDFSQKETMSGFVGVVRFSNILFNDQGDKAICVVEMKDAFKSSRYDLLLCEKLADKWKVIRRETISQS